MTDSPQETPEILKWRGKPITELSIEDLAVVQTTLKNMFETNINIKFDPKYAERFKGQSVPDINPHFAKLRNAIDKEIEDRKKL